MLRAAVCLSVLVWLEMVVVDDVVGGGAFLILEVAVGNTAAACNMAWRCVRVGGALAVIDAVHVWSRASMGASHLSCKGAVHPD